MKTSVRVVGLICVVMLSGAFLPSAATASFTSQDMGTYILWSQISTNTYFQQYKADYSWKDSTSSSSGWNYLGKLGDLSTLLFDGAGHKFVDNNYSYSFNGTSGVGVWQNASLGVNQYGFNYNTGQWYDQGNWGGWAYLGSPTLSASFIGDSGSHTLGSNWSYVFDGTYGYWKNGNMNNVNQYAYNYTTGNWYDQGNWGGWAYLGSPTLSASFVGDSGSHTLGGNWSYVFDGAYGYWNNASMNNLSQYAYNYTTGNWYDHGSLGGWATLGPSTLSGSFMGDGNWHTLDGIWSYELVSGVGYLKGSVSTWVPLQYGQSYWNSSPKQLTCNYTSQIFGLYDSGVTSSVFLYDYNGGNSYNCKWTDWNYNSISRAETSAEIVFYTGNVTHDASSWLSWLPVQPNPGPITRTETWDFTSSEHALDGIYAHQVRAFWTNQWVVQNEQGSLGNCTVVAALDALEQVTGLYWDMGQIITLAESKGWLTSGGMSLSDIPALYTAMGKGTVYTKVVSTSDITTLTNWTNAGNPVVVGVDLAYIPQFGNYPSGSGHALVFHGVDGQGNVEITNGWYTQPNTTQTTGTDPVYAYPITLIPQNEFQNSWVGYGDWAVLVRVN